ncbi:MAG: hypothetical protein ACRD19_05195 [Terriglobia bacterium]
MPVSQAVATVQVRRFKNHPKPAGADLDEAQVVLTRAFREACADDTEAKKVGEWLERTAHFFPVPADVYEAANSVRLNDKNRIPEWTGIGYKCATCQDTGWIGYEKDSASFAKRCPDCAGRVRRLERAAGGGNP